MTAHEGVQTALRLTGISKRFGSLVANDDISLTLQSGEVLALLGENGAGKSTLMSILFGHYSADAGHIEVFGQALRGGDPKAALAAGIGMVHQHFTLADNLSVLDNVMLGSESLWALRTQRSKARTKLSEVGARFGLRVEPDALVSQLSVGERQRVEILKALYRGARVLILDEPTAVLTPQESEALFAVLAQMVAVGLSIIFISHKLDEVMRVSHRVAVLRAGKLVAESATVHTNAAQLAQWMVGHSVNTTQRQPAAAVGAAVCVLHEVQAGHGRERLHGINLTLRAGEIVAIAGISGNGQASLAGLLCGTVQASGGRVTLLGQPMPLQPACLTALGVARIPEDRQAVGVVGDLPLWQNAVAERLRTPAFSHYGWIKAQAAQAYTQAVVEKFDVRGGGALVAARALSGGNMQKLILGRALMAPTLTPEGRGDKAEAPQWPVLIVAHQPTWGLDIGAVTFVQAQLLAARDAGAAVLIISDDLNEVMLMGDHIAVIHSGHLTAPRPAAAWTRTTIGLAMAGAEQAEELACA